MAEIGNSFRVRGGHHATDAAKLCQCMGNALKRFDEIELLTVGDKTLAIAIDAVSLLSKQISEKTTNISIVMRIEPFDALVDKEITTGRRIIVFSIVRKT